MESDPVRFMLAQSKLNRVPGKFIIQFALVFFVIFYAVQGSRAGIFSYRDNQGAIHFTDDVSKIPQPYRESKQGVRQHREVRGAHRATSVPSAGLARIFHEKEVANPFQAIRIRLSDHSKKGIRRDRLYTRPT